ncbi:unnamed protein product [Caenorhabditis auriculariae]|uniref:Rhodanese domain-containing protein n=1 Tax=Caenorhabditis auriculariae TaxID=2777116 RepID=A0A8S1H832_9PELO|nr:unnamed protein product [Caenorhabditis auriculariae]
MVSVAVALRFRKWKKIEMTVPEIVDPTWLVKHFYDVKLIDATYTLKPQLNPEDFKEKYFGKFEQLINDFKNEEYQKEHITGAVNFNADIAFYPSKNVKFALYEPRLFEQYVQLLGVKRDDHVLIYARGPVAGMLFASRAYWTFKIYGFENVSVLNGGLEAWKAIGGAVKSGEEKPQKGDFEAKEIDEKLLAQFEEIPFNHLENVQYLDARPKEQFTGEQPLGFPDAHVTGAHVKGAQSFPLSEILTSNGVKSKEDVDAVIESHQISKGKPVIVVCNGGIQASVLFLALKRSGIDAKVYNGSMYELVKRAPELINSK